ncbi:anti-sigma factor domain-containing protein [Streptomyces sp. NPDC058695]|uniref:anti-sigma factor n=1 Tax=Streptomyces sp. NPDC058695 TaxID=3346604 RepID=UPI0036609385
MTVDTADAHTLTGAYALDALNEDERATFEKHMAQCGTCALEVQEFSATAGRLALAATSRAPEHLKSQVLRQIGQVRQGSPGVKEIESGSRRRRSGKAMQWALAACVAAVAALGATTAWQYQQADHARRQAQAAQVQSDQIAAVLAAPDAKVTSTSLDGGARGSVVVSQDTGKAVFIASHMTPPPKGKVYQLWFADGGHMRPAGLMDASRTDQSVLMTGPVDQAKGIGVTLEPAGGSQQPTSQPLATMELPA